MRKTIIALAILAPVAAFAATKPAGCALLDEAACSANRACAWSPPMVRGEKSPTTGKPYKITRRGYCHRRPLRSVPASSAAAVVALTHFFPDGPLARAHCDAPIGIGPERHHLISWRLIGGGTSEAAVRKGSIAGVRLPC